MLPIVFIHGLIGPFTDPSAVALLRPAEVLSPDLLGYGSEADADPTDVTIESQIEYVRIAIGRELPDTRVHVVGHSVGGVIAAGFAHRFPDRVASFVSVEGNFTLGDAFWSAQLAAKTLADVEYLLEADRADPARWLRDGGIDPTDEHVRACFAGPGLSTRLHPAGDGRRRALFIRSQVEAVFAGWTRQGG